LLCNILAFLLLVVFSDIRFFVVLISSKLAATVVEADKMELARRRKAKVVRRAAEADIEVANTLVVIVEPCKDFMVNDLEGSCFEEATIRFLVVGCFCSDLARVSSFPSYQSVLNLNLSPESDSDGLAFLLLLRMDCLWVAPLQT
jgi:hypothetical protein